MDALQAIEAPSSIMFHREVPDILVSTPPLVYAPVFRPPPVVREKPRPRGGKGEQFVYIQVPKSTVDDELQPMILRCSTCLKSSFSSLQGLYNHARITHQLDWGNHEECIKACAFPMEPHELANLDKGMEVGAASLPGVRTLFQRALDEGRKAEIIKKEDAIDVDEEPPSTNINHLSSTLGLHQDTPALAALLGKEAKRRKIRIDEDEDALVDITFIDGGTPTRPVPRNTWKMAFPARGIRLQDGEIREPEILALLEEDLPESKPVLPGTHEPHSLRSLQPDSRFHIVSRVAITDRSFFIPIGLSFHHVLLGSSA
jgi:hypothetical protein